MNKLKLPLAGLLSLAGLASLTTDPRPYAPTEMTAEDLNWAQSYLAEHYIPLPDDWMWGTFALTKGHVRYGMSGPANAEATILFVPGYSGTAELYTDFYRRWRAAGYRIIVMDLPGQGKSIRHRKTPEKAWSGDFEVYAQILRDFIQFADNLSAGPLVLVGESFGGHVAMRTVADYPVSIDGLYLMAPAFEVQTPGLPRWIANRTFQLSTGLGFGKGYVIGQGQWSPNWNVDTETYRCGTRPDRLYIQQSLYALDPELRVSGVTNEWMHGVQTSGARLIQKKRLNQVNVPVRMMLAGRDTVVDNRRALKACSALLPMCSYQVQDDAQHCFSMEPNERIDTLFSDLDALVDIVRAAP